MAVPWLDIVLAALTVLCLALAFALGRTELQARDMDGLPAAGPEPGWWRQWLYPARLIRQAGLMPGALRWLYWPGRLLLALLLPLALLEWHGPWSHWAVVGASALVGLHLPDLWLLRRRRRRRARVLRGLGFFADVLAAYLRAGLPVSRAFEQAARFAFRSEHPLAREATLVCTELRAGRALDAALRAMAQRTGVQALQQLAAVVAIGARVGAPILDTLEHQSQALGDRQALEVEQALNRKSLELLFPIALACVPVFLVLVAFPAAVQLLETLRILRLLL